MPEYGKIFPEGLKYDDFLKRYATPEQLERWNASLARVKLTEQQRGRLSSFTRDMKVLVLNGAWCGDCIDQCPILARFAELCPKISLRFFDRDDNPQLAEALQTCGGARVPAVLFLSEDDFVCGRYGDRTLAKYRDMVANLSGEACSTGLGEGESLHEQVIAEWLGQFERIQFMLRTSGRLRKKHGD